MLFIATTTHGIAPVTTASWSREVAKLRPVNYLLYSVSELPVFFYFVERSCWFWTFCHISAKIIHSESISLRSALFWDLTQPTVVISYRRLGTPYVSYFQESSNPTLIITFYAYFGTTCGSLQLRSGTRPCL